MSLGLGVLTWFWCADGLYIDGRKWKVDYASPADLKYALPCDVLQSRCCKQCEKIDLRKSEYAASARCKPYGMDVEVLDRPCQRVVSRIDGSNGADSLGGSGLRAVVLDLHHQPGNLSRTIFHDLCSLSLQ